MLATAAPIAVGHGDAVAGRDVGVGGVEVDLAGAAGGEHGGARADRLDLAGRAVEHVGAEAAGSPPYLAIDSRSTAMWSASTVMLSAWRDAAASSARWISRAGGVLVVDDAAGAVAALAAELEVRPRASRSKSTPERGQARGRACRALAHAQLDDVADGTARRRRERVLDVPLEGVVVAEHRGDAALRPVGVRVVRALLGDDDDPAVLGGPQREVEAGDPRPDDQVVRRQLVGHGAIYRFCAPGSGW